MEVSSVSISFRSSCLCLFYLYPDRDLHTHPHLHIRFLFCLSLSYPYLPLSARLWCCFELAAFIKLRGIRNVHFLSLPLSAFAISSCDRMDVFDAFFFQISILCFKKCTATDCLCLIRLKSERRKSVNLAQAVRISGDGGHEGEESKENVLLGFCTQQEDFLAKAPAVVDWPVSRVRVAWHITCQHMSLETVASFYVGSDIICSSIMETRFAVTRWGDEWTEKLHTPHSPGCVNGSRAARCLRLILSCAGLGKILG